MSFPLIVFALPFEAKGFCSENASVWIAGRGAVFCARSFARHITSLSPPPSFVVSAGLAGGLAPHLKVADLVVCSNHGSADLRDSASRAGFFPAPCAHAETVLSEPREKIALHKISGASICDMETAPIAEICASLALPFVGLRAVSDAASAPLPIPAEYLLNPDTGKPQVARLLAHLAIRPTRWAAFSKMLADANTAKRALFSGLRQFLGHME